MYQSVCKKCGSISLHTEVKGNATGLYCDDCGAWVKWLGKDELRAFEYSKKEERISSDESMVKRLNDFIDYIDRRIDSEYKKYPTSTEDAIRKNSYCLALEQNKNAIQNILSGHDFCYVEE